MTVQLAGSTFWPWAAPVREHDWGSGLHVHRLAPDAHAPRIHSAAPCVLLLIDGTLLLSSYRGRERLERGMLAIRPTFDARAFRAGSGGAVWLQLPWLADHSFGATHRVADAEALMLRAATDLPSAQSEIAGIAASSPALPVARLHWVDDLHRAIVATPDLAIAGWARANHVSREAAARGFRLAYDVRPSRFRLEIRARHAWTRIVATGDPLSLVALESGFADQSHMTRAVGWLTGRPPAAWRKARG